MSYPVVPELLREIGLSNPFRISAVGPLFDQTHPGSGACHRLAGSYSPTSCGGIVSKFRKELYGSESYPNLRSRSAFIPLGSLPPCFQVAFLQLSLQVRLENIHDGFGFCTLEVLM